MSATQLLIFSGVAIAWIAIVFRPAKCRHKHVTWPTGGYGADKMTGKQHCLDCGSERFLKLGEKGEWFRRENQRSSL